MKGLKKTVRSVVNDSYKDSNAINHEGFKCWKQSDKEQLMKYAMTGSLGHSFYCNQKDVVEEVDSLLKRADAQDIENAIVIGRNEGFIRSFPILGLVYLSQKDTKLFKSCFNKVVKTGNDLIDFIEICKSIRGLGRAIKTAVNDWIKTNCNEYYAMKYRNQIADAIRLTRFNGDDPIYSFVLKKYSDRIKSFDVEKYNKCFEKYPILNAHKRFIENVKDNNLKDALRIIQFYRLDVDSLTSCYDKFDKNIWAEIARLTPVMRFIKYLNKFDEVGVFDDNLELLKEKINVENLKYAKVFPFRLYIAYKYCKNEKVRNYLVDVIDDYVSKYNWNKFNDHKWIIAPDVSGSMSSQISNSDITFSELSGMFSGFLRKGIKDCTIIPWDTCVHQFNVPKKDSVLTHINEIKRMCGGGTYMETAVNYCIKNNITNADCFVFITDTEEYGSGWINAWKKYKSINKKAKAFLLRSDMYVHNPVSDADAEKYDVYQIFSWNDNAIRFIEGNL